MWKGSANLEVSQLEIKALLDISDGDDLRYRVRGMGEGTNSAV